MASLRRGKMERGISRAMDNEPIVQRARNSLQRQCKTDHDNIDSNNNSSSSHEKETDNDGASGNFHVDTPIATFRLPDLSQFKDDFRRFLEDDLIETSSLVSLEQCNRLNWWHFNSECRASRLWPLATTGDGNCLLHAASLGLWGFHDRLLTLRKSLHAFLSSRSPSCASLYRRWRWQLHLQHRQLGLTLSEEEWDKEWRSVLQLASSKPRQPSNSHSSSSSSQASDCSMSTASSSAASPGSVEVIPTARRWSSSNRRLSMALINQQSSSINHDSNSEHQLLYESLEEVHVFALAHVLRRPIIVVADTVLRDMNGDALAPIPFGGIYLPLECHPQKCYTCPLLLVYNNGHFSALVAMQEAEDDEEPDNGGLQTRTYDNKLPALVPLTDSSFSLLPLQFSVDPGVDFVWNRDEMDVNVVKMLQWEEHNHARKLQLLQQYLQVVKVVMPMSNTDVVDGSRFATESSAVGRRGNFGLLKKGFSKLSLRRKKKRTNAKEHNVTQYSDNCSSKSSSRSNSSTGSTTGGVGTLDESFLAALLKVEHQPYLPYQNEMVENYLHEAYRRFEREKHNRQLKVREEMEREEQRKRAIFLNGGVPDCKTVNCCNPCTKDSDYCSQCNAKSVFYLPTPDEEAFIDNQRLTVRLPPSLPVLRDDVDSPALEGGKCRSDECEFYGALEFDHMCSKCFQQKQQQRQVEGEDRIRRETKRPIKRQTVDDVHL